MHPKVSPSVIKHQQTSASIIKQVSFSIFPLRLLSDKHLLFYHVPNFRKTVVTFVKCSKWPLSEICNQYWLVSAWTRTGDCIWHWSLVPGQWRGETDSFNSSPGFIRKSISVNFVTQLDIFNWPGGTKSLKISVTALMVVNTKDFTTTNLQTIPL